MIAERKASFMADSRVPKTKDEQPLKPLRVTVRIQSTNAAILVSDSIGRGTRANEWDWVAISSGRMENIQEILPHIDLSGYEYMVIRFQRHDSRHTTTKIW